MRKRLLPYGASNSARDLARSLRIMRLKLTGSRFRASPSDVILNWGSPRSAGQAQYINRPDAVEVAGNKLLAFERLVEAGVTVPVYTTSEDTAVGWYHDGGTVVCRTLLRANSGRGIVIASQEGEDVVSAPLYTKYVKKSQEYRVHVFGGVAKDVQRKMRSREVQDEDVNWQIRNTAGGFIYGREGYESIPELEQIGVDAVQALGLDFGAVDIIYNRHENQYYVLEVNTAPGLEGTTLEIYTNELQRMLGGHNV